MTTLPDKPSELLRVAIADCRKVFADPLYEFNPYVWVDQTPHRPCNACIAGAVMIGSLNIGNKSYYDDLLGDLDPTTIQRLCALDDLREGYLGVAIARLGYEIPSDIQQIWNMPNDEYQLDPIIHAFEEMAEMLERHGL